MYRVCVVPAAYKGGAFLDEAYPTFREAQERARNWYKVDRAALIKDPDGYFVDVVTGKRKGQ